MVNLITEYIDIWTSAQTQKAIGGRGRGINSNGQSPHGIKKLRELILELAVRGKLAPQDPNDEPASDLLEKIAKEKARLIKEVKIKKQKKLPEIGEDEKPFDLPIGWEWVRLGDVGNIFNGNSISARVKEEKYTNIVGGLPFIATKDVGYGWEELDYGNGVSIPKGEPKFKVAHKGAVLICAEGGSAGKKCGITNQDISFGNKLFANDLYGNIEPSYILANYLSPTFFYQFSSRMTGIIGGIPASKFIQLLLPIPPLAEQSRIVAKVDELMALCDQLEQQQTDNNAAHQILLETLLSTLTNSAGQGEFFEAWQRIANHFDTLFTTEQSIDQLKQTILQLAVMGKLVPQDPKDEPASALLKKIAKEKKRLIKEGKIKKQKTLPEISEAEKPFVLPWGMEWARLQTLVFLLGDGLHGTPNYTPGTKYYFVNGNNLNNGKIEIKPNTKTVSFEEMLKNKKYLSPNAVLVSINGTLGNVAFYNGEEIILGKSACYFNLAEYVSKHFIKIVIESAYFMSYAFRNATGSTIKNLSLNAMNGFPVPLPPIAEQHRIVEKVDELMALCETLKERLKDVQTTQVHLADAIVEQTLV